MIRTMAFTDLCSFDLILQKQDGEISRAIEEEESSAYSHLAIVFRDQAIEAHPQQGVIQRPIKDFLNSGKGSHLVLRHPKASELNWDHLKTYLGRPYNAFYRWEETQTVYCSQLAALVFQSIEVISPKPMHFSKNKNLWIKILGDRLPEGKPGLSPGDFERHPAFVKMGYITSISV